MPARVASVGRAAQHPAPPQRIQTTENLEPPITVDFSGDSVPNSTPMSVAAPAPAVVAEAAPIPSAPPRAPDGQASSALITRVLGPEEHDLLREVPPFDEIGPPDPARARVSVVQDPVTGKVLGFLMFSQCVHVEPFWLDPSIRKRPGVIRRLWRGVRQLMEETNNPCVFSVINYEDMPRGILPQATGLGFQHVPGVIFMTSLASLPEWTLPREEELTVLDRAVRRT